MKSNDELLAAVIKRAVNMARYSMTVQYRTPTGNTRAKTKTERLVDTERLDMMVEVLDRDFNWYGPWGSTPYGIRQELFRRAAEETANDRTDYYDLNRGWRPPDRT